MKIIVTPTSTRTSEELAERFRDALRRSGLSLDRLAARLGERGHRVSRTTLSNWQRGRTRPARGDSLAALPDLEALLGIEPGGLRAEPPDPVDHGESSFETLSLYESSYVGPSGWPIRRETRQVVRATRNGISRIDLRLQGEEAPSLRVVAGGHPGRPARDDTGTWYVPVEMGRRLATGESHFLDLTWDGEARLMDRVVAEPIAHLLLRTTFHPEALPSAVMARIGGQVERVRVDDQGTAHRLLINPRAGEYQLQSVEELEVRGRHQA